MTFLLNNPTDWAHRLAKVLNREKRTALNTLELPFRPREAAVLVLILSRDGGESIVFTKRTEEVEHHKGQICFPGGVHDNKDETLWHTALRETHEEIGVEEGHVTYIGQLGSVVTPTGFLVTPFVGYSAHPLRFTPSPVEIAEIITAPLPHFLHPDHLQFETKTFNNTEYQDPVFSYQHHKIWGATGRILMDLLEVWKSIT